MHIFHYISHEETKLQQNVAIFHPVGRLQCTHRFNNTSTTFLKRTNIMKKFALATVMSLIAASAMASGAPTDRYPYGHPPPGHSPAVTNAPPPPPPHRPAKSDDSVKFAYIGDTDGAAYNLYPTDNFRARYADIR